MIIITWLISFGLSFLAPNFFDMSQGKAFFYLFLGLNLIFVVTFTVIAIICKASGNELETSSGRSPFLLIFFMLLGCILPVGVAWIINAVFPTLDYFIVYEVVTAALFLTGSKKK